MQREYKISLSQEFYSDVVHISQYDSDYDIVFNVTNKYASANVNNLSAKFTGKRPPAPGATEGLGFEFTSTGSGTAVTFHIDNTVSAVAGTGTGEIVFYDANGLYFGSANVQIIVEPAAHPNDTIDANVEEEQALADEIREMIESIGDDVTTVVNAKNDAVAAKESAEGSASTASADALLTEGYAVGKQNGSDVGSDSPYYHNNAKYFAESAGSSATSAAGSATAAGQSATAASSSTAAIYSSSATYAVGDYCVYNSQLYRCTTAITTAEAWTAAHWTAVTVGGDLSALNENLNAIGLSVVDGKLCATYTEGA